MPKAVRRWLRDYLREWRRANPERVGASHLRRKAKEREDPSIRREARRKFLARLKADPERMARYREANRIRRRRARRRASSRARP